MEMQQYELELESSWQPT